MNLIHPSPLLKTALLADAAVGAAAGALHLALAAPLAGWLRLPQTLVLDSGLFLAAFVALLLVMARSKRLASAAVMAIVVSNVGWAIASLLLMAMAAPSALGIAYLSMNALSVLVFAALEFRGLATSARALTPATAGAH